MSSKIRCPGCGRKLAIPSGTVEMACDGCGLGFRPASVVYRPAPVWKQLLGWPMLFLAGIGFLTGLRIALLELNPRHRDYIPTLLGTFALPVVFFFGGLALLRGKDVVEE